jgi:hypothetical protein
MEQGRLGGVTQEQEGVLGWVELEKERWVAPEQVQVLAESACVQNAGRLSLMM